MVVVVDVRGTVRCLYGEAIDLGELGQMQIRRVSHVEPDDRGRWWADLLPVGGPRLGPCSLRSEALAAETGWLEGDLLEPPALAAPGSRPGRPAETVCEPGAIRAAERR